MLHYLVLGTFLYLVPRTLETSKITLFGVLGECFTNSGSLRLLYLLIIGSFCWSMLTALMYHTEPRTLERIFRRENADFILFMGFFFVVQVWTHVRDLRDTHP